MNEIELKGVELEFTPEQKKGYLQWLCNKYGNFKVSCAFKNQQGEMIWTKHHSVLECWESDAGLDFLSKANHRQIFPFEIILDFDPEKDETPKETYQRVLKAIKTLRERDCKYYAYFSGSRGYHIAWQQREFYTKEKFEREDLKQWIIKSLGCEELKAKENVMIAMEFTPNSKTGGLKKLIDHNCPLPEPIQEILGIQDEEIDLGIEEI